MIVLSRPSEPGNVGAVCRAMKNMGLSRLRLVDAGDKPLDEAIIQARTVHAADIWERAEHFSSLAEAVKDISLVIGITRRRGQRRKAATTGPGEMAEMLRGKPGQAALVFGNERTGLEAREIALCNLASHIPASEIFPSLNLSHAVQIYAYELYMALSVEAEAAVEGQWIPLDREAVDALTQSITNALESLGFYKQPGRTEQERFFRDIISRAALMEREGRYLADIFAKASRLGCQASRLGGCQA